MYKILQGGIGIPNVYWYGADAGCNVMVMDLLGPTLEELFTERCGGHFSLKTILYIADQALRRLEYIHSKNFVHRDIKPENFALGLGPAAHNTIHCIDFGLAKRYRDEAHVHAPYREGKRLTGTARYASINTHLGIEQSRRDDIESLAYVLLYFARGSLPWQGIRAPDGRDSTKFALICEMKRRSTPETLCAGLPEELGVFLAYARALHFEDKPDYAYLHMLVKSLFLKEGLVLDNTFDWDLPKKGLLEDKVDIEDKDEDEDDEKSEDEDDEKSDEEEDEEEEDDDDDEEDDNESNVEKEEEEEADEDEDLVDSTSHSNIDTVSDRKRRHHHRHHHHHRHRHHRDDSSNVDNDNTRESSDGEEDE